MKYIRWILLTLVLLALAALPNKVSAQANCGEIYSVKRGDSLAKIAKRCGTTLSFLLLVNPQIEKPRLIYPGQEINIPQPIERNSASDASKDHLASAIHPDVGTGERWIDIDISKQALRAYEGEELLRTFIVSTGTWRTPTVTGQFNIWIKFRSDDMRGPDYFLEDVPYTMYFHKGYGIHGTYWHDNFGHPMSHGCVNMTIDDAAWMFEFASLGTLVNVHE